MNLALFTPSAYLWPVLRNFDVFIASLGAPRTTAESVQASALYPLAEPAAFVPLERALEARLQQLQRELYAALLRESSYYRTDRRTLDQAFWPDLVGTSIGDLLEAFVFYFTWRLPSDMPLLDGLAVLRAVFFNHATAEPELWMHAAEERLAALPGVRDVPAKLTAQFFAPAQVRLQDLAFAVNTRRGAAPHGLGWLRGELRRSPTGLVRVTVQCAVDPQLASERVEAARQLEQRMQRAVEDVFGWALAEVA